MGKVTENEIKQICDQFDALDRSKCGKLTIVDIMESD